MSRLAERLAPSDVGLTAEEYERICQVLEREPNSLELGMFGVLWSEHCSYKHSRGLLRRLPTAGAHVLQGPGENAGAVNIGDGLAAVMKIESHNHPSAVEPVQGAATGVGGIIRDILAMGARPIALLDALCFGAPEDRRTTYLVGGVVEGISSYGNCVGVPTVGGSITFDAAYQANPLVNALCLGIAPSDRLVRARAEGEGSPVLLVGARTGRDGIAGASFASAELGSASEEQRPAVQVANPFLEKLLIEACLEVVQGSDVVALQDLGAAGLTGAATEVAARGGHGIEIDVNRVPRREQSMTPSEVMLSESQERMLLVGRPGAEGHLRRVFEHWGLPAAVVGHITGDGLVRVKEGDRVVAELPAKVLSDGAAEYQGPPVGPPEILPDARRQQASKMAAGPARPFPIPSDLNTVLLDLLGSPNLCSRRPVFEEYDHMVQINTVVPPGEGAAVLRLKGTRKGLALGLGSNGRACHLDPWTGGAMAVAEACRNVSCAGAEPIALTDCLNFGDPERAEVWEAMVGVVEGMRAASLALEVPIISGNVSLYNESNGSAILPTPVVGAVGVINDVARSARAVLTAGQDLWLLGPMAGALGGSEYASHLHGWQGSLPELDLDLERRVQGCVRELIAAGDVATATDVAEGGLAVALAELALAGSVGVRCDGDWLNNSRPDALLFGEAPSRIIIGAGPEHAGRIHDAARRWGVPVVRIGAAAGREISIGEQISVSLDSAAGRWGTALDRLLGI